MTQLRKIIHSTYELFHLRTFFANITAQKEACIFSWMMLVAVWDVKNNAILPD